MAISIGEYLEDLKSKDTLKLLGLSNFPERMTPNMIDKQYENFLKQMEQLERKIIKANETVIPKKENLLREIRFLKSRARKTYEEIKIIGLMPYIRKQNSLRNNKTPQLPNEDAR